MVPDCPRLSPRPETFAPFLQSLQKHFFLQLQHQLRTIKAREQGEELQRALPKYCSFRVAGQAPNFLRETRRARVFMVTSSSSSDGARRQAFLRASPRRPTLFGNSTPRRPRSRLPPAAIHRAVRRAAFFTYRNRGLTSLKIRTLLGSCKIPKKILL